MNYSIIATQKFEKEIKRLIKKHDAITSIKRIRAGFGTYDFDSTPADEHVS